MISFGLVQNKITDVLQSDQQTEDSIQGIIAFATGIGLLVLILVICIFVLFFTFVQPLTRVISKEVQPKESRIYSLKNKRINRDS